MSDLSVIDWLGASCIALIVLLCIAEWCGYGLDWLMNIEERVHE